MKRFDLTADLQSGLTDIDEDHREIFEAGNRITSPAFINSDSKTLEEELSFLEDYVLYHFAAEEYAMSNEGFPGTENHSKLHKNFQQKISGYVNTFRTEGISKKLILKISFAIEDWLIQHIRLTDRDFTHFLKQKNVESIHLPSVKKLKEAGMLPKKFNDRIAANR